MWQLGVLRIGQPSNQKCNVLTNVTKKGLVMKSNDLSFQACTVPSAIWATIERCFPIRLNALYLT